MAAPLVNRATPPPAGGHAGQGQGLGRGAGAALVNAGFGHIARMIALLERIASAAEAEAEYDVTFVVGGTNAGAAVQAVQSIPRSLRHVEITLTVDSSTPVSVALFSGNITLPDAQNRHKLALSSSGAICSSSGGNVTVRDYLDQTGYLTVYFSAAATTYANVRVRSLDRRDNQSRR